MQLSSIKGKLTLLLVVLGLGFAALGYMGYKNSQNAQSTAKRLTLLGKVGTDIQGSMALLRGYQLMTKQEMLDGYTKSTKDVVNNLEQLSSIILLKENNDRIQKIKQDFLEWKNFNEKRIELITKHGKKINQDSFASENKADYDIVATKTLESAKVFNVILKDLGELLEGVNRVNFENLETNDSISRAVLVFTIIMTLVVFFWVDNSVKDSVKKAKDGCEAIKKTKDLTFKIQTGHKDEINDAMEAVNNLLSDVLAAFAQAKLGSFENASVAEQLSTTSFNIEKRVEAEAEIVKETVGSVKKVAEDISNVSAEAKIAQNTIVEAQQNLSKAQEMLETTVEHLAQTTEVEININTMLNELSTEAQQVKSVLTVIGDIADQTNLLALNASIEAARAGEHGRGFAVVADEVRKLAERTQKSLIETNATINVIVQSIDGISGEMNNNVERIENLSNSSTEVMDQTLKAVEMLSKSVEAIGDVASSAQNNERLINIEIATKIESINVLSSENTRSVEEIAQAAHHLSKLSSDLSSTLSQFKTI